MKLDLELVRRLMLNANDATEPYEIEWEVNTTYSRAKVGRHVSALVDAGLMKATITAAEDDPYYAVIISGVTPQGRDFADNIRSNSLWNETKTKLKATAGGIAIPLLVKLCEEAVLKAVGL